MSNIIVASLAVVGFMTIAILICGGARTFLARIEWFVHHDIGRT